MSKSTTEVNALYSGRSTLKAVVSAIQEAHRAGAGFSLVRLGDGEGRLLRWLEVRDRDAVAHSLDVWFGSQDVSSDDVTAIAGGLRRAALSADVTGLPTRFQVEERGEPYRHVLSELARCGPPRTSQLVTDANIHWYLQFSGAFRLLLRDQKFLGLVGPRDIGPAVAKTFGIASVETHLVRGEKSYAGAVTRPHWPASFAEIMARLEPPYPGAMYLVGAGALGKIYCQTIKERGGVAIDIGSLFDSWANVPSRLRYERGSPVYTLDHFAQVGEGWDEMMSRLRECISEFDIRDGTY